MTTQERWTNAINRAIELDGERAATYVGAGRFLVVSAHDSGAYEVTIDRNGETTCTCRAAEFGNPCWHQATAKLVAGFADAPQDEPTDDAPAFDAAALGAFLANPESVFESA